VEKDTLHLFPVFTAEFVVFIGKIEFCYLISTILVFQQFPVKFVIFRSWFDIDCDTKWPCEADVFLWILFILNHSL